VERLLIDDRARFALRCCSAAPHPAGRLCVGTGATWPLAPRRRVAFRSQPEPVTISLALSRERCHEQSV
jgi:hypothetical protein